MESMDQIRGDLKPSNLGNRAVVRAKGGVLGEYLEPRNVHITS